MLKTFLKTTALFFLLSTSFSSVGAETLSAKQLLQEMKKAADQLNYEFSFVQTTPSNMDSLRYRHFKVNGKTFAQLPIIYRHSFMRILIPWNNTMIL